MDAQFDLGGMLHYEMEQTYCIHVCALYVCVHCMYVMFIWCALIEEVAIYTVVSGRVNCVGVVDSVQWEGIWLCIRCSSLSLQELRAMW